MTIDCPSCRARYKFDQNKLGSRPSVRTKCPKCGAAIDIENPLMSALTLPPPPDPMDALDAPTGHPDQDTGRTHALENVMADGSRQETAGHDMFASGALTLTPGKRYSLAVIQGAATGQIYSITQARVVIGRQGADINLDDGEASRQHSAIEILGEHAIVRDLGSTNGTFVDAARIEQHVLTNQMEFRIGSHVLMFIVTSEDVSPHPEE